MDKGGEEMNEEKGFSGGLDHKGRWMLLPPSARFLCAAPPGGRMEKHQHHETRHIQSGEYYGNKET